MSRQSKFLEKKNISLLKLIAIFTLTTITFILIFSVSFKSGIALLLGILLFLLIQISYKVLKFGFTWKYALTFVFLLILTLPSLFLLRIKPNNPFSANYDAGYTPLVEANVKRYKATLRPHDDSLTNLYVLEEATFQYKPAFELLKSDKYRGELAKDFLWEIESEENVLNYIDEFLPDFIKRYFTVEPGRSLYSEKPIEVTKVKKDIDFSNTQVQNEILELLGKDFPIKTSLQEVESSTKGFAVREVSFEPIIASMKADPDKGTKIEFVLESFPKGSFFLFKREGKKEEFPYIDNTSTIKISMDGIDRIDNFSFAYFTFPWYLCSPLIAFIEDITSKGPTGIPILFGLTVAAFASQFLGKIYTEAFEDKIKPFLPFIGQKKENTNENKMLEETKKPEEDKFEEENKDLEEMIRSFEKLHVEKNSNKNQY